MDIIANKTFDEERALYALKDSQVINCTFAGPADGESALKEACGIEVENCRFSLRYPFWHTTGFSVKNCRMDDTARAALWYCRNGELDGLVTDGIKGVRECEDISLKNVTAVSPEFGWKCRGLRFENCAVTGDYFLLDSRELKLENVTLNGKYSFQYTENVTVENCELNTKDAFWHAKNVTVKNCKVKGEYLAWYSENITFINCEISGTQPLCYCKGLKLIDCTMIGCDLSFEYSDVAADVKGHIDSVKNPRSGRISAHAIGEIIREGAVIDTDCVIEIKDEDDAPA